MLKGINLTLKIGPNNPKPAPLLLMEALNSVEVTRSDEGRSGFQLVFQVGRSGADQKDYQMFRKQMHLLTPFNRVILIVQFSATAKVLMDGVITNQQFSPSMQLGGSTFTVTGEDVSVMMDLEEKSDEHPVQNPKEIITRLISNYSQYGLKPDVADPEAERPQNKERIPVQQETDLNYINTLGKRYGFVFYIKPGPSSGQNIAYWGPPKKGTKVQKALSVNMLSFTNVSSINFQYNGLAATTVSGKLQERNQNEAEEIEVSTTDRERLAKKFPLKLQSQSHVRVTKFRESGITQREAEERAQAMVNKSIDEVVTATGELDTLRYGDLLQPRQRVGLRGVGYNLDGIYYVKSVSHKINRGEYKQSFTITREGVGTTVQRVKV